MKGKIIYVDFTKKRRVTFMYFLANKIVTFIFAKFNVRTNTAQNINLYNSKRISQ